MVQITARPIDIASLITRLRKDRDGAVVTFLGCVRSPSDGRHVLSMEYEAYKELAASRLRQIAGEIKEKWGLKDVGIVHRVGKLKPGDAAVGIIVCAPHRKEAFAACQYAIDRIKEVVPIWKKEVFAGGKGKWVAETPH